ncbi:hypothetical protein VTN02DRAFT_3379 [Thermoascus thermophilus]
MTRRDRGSTASTASTPRDHPPHAPATGHGKMKPLDSSLGSWKRRSLPADWREQPTLTQIDFVTRTPGPDDEDLEYVEDHNSKGRSGRDNGEKAKEVIDLDDDDDDDDDLEYRPTLPPRLRRKSQRHTPGKDVTVSRYTPPSASTSASARKVRFQSSNPPSSIRSSGKNGGPGRSRASGKSGGKANTKAKKDKTLTQMDFVRRYLIIEDDDDDNLEYIPSGDKGHGHGNVAGQQGKDKQDDLDRERAEEQPQVDRSKKRKLNDGSDVPSGSPNVPPSLDGLGRPFDQDTVDPGSPPPGPVTPQKPRKFEIPSSQSPESPGFAIISSSQFRSAARSPLRALSPGKVEKTSPKRPGSNRSVPVKKASQSPVGVSIPLENAVAEHSTAIDSLASTQSPSKRVAPRSSPSQSTPRPKSRESPSESKSSSDETTPVARGKPEHGVPARFEKNVVYETDAETDYSDFEDPWTHLPGPDDQQGLLDDGKSSAANDQDPRSDASQGLPPPVPNSGTDLEADIHTSEMTLSSDASIYYRRPEQCTQFPTGPIPALSTQNLAELFPQHDSTPRQSQAEAALPEPVIPATNHDAVQQDPLLPTQTETQTQTQTQTQDPDKDSTEVVPESSLIQPPEATGPSNNNSNHHHSGPRSHGRESVVLVESSQPVDRLRKKQDGRRGILSTSQLLTDSLMESIPAPPLWMSSQSSLGELESLPGG